MNNALLCLPVLVGLIENFVIDVPAGVVGCGVLFGIGVWVGRKK